MKLPLPINEGQLGFSCTRILNMYNISGTERNIKNLKNKLKQLLDSMSGIHIPQQNERKGHFYVNHLLDPTIGVTAG